MIDTRHTRTWGSAVKVIAIEVVTLLALFALQQAFAR
jgi:hypothetical protein